MPARGLLFIPVRMTYLREALSESMFRNSSKVPGKGQVWQRAHLDVERTEFQDYPRDLTPRPSCASVPNPAAYLWNRPSRLKAVTMLTGVGTLALRKDKDCCKRPTVCKGGILGVNEEVIISALNCSKPRSQAPKSLKDENQARSDVARKQGTNGYSHLTGRYSQSHVWSHTHTPSSQGVT